MLTKDYLERRWDCTIDWEKKRFCDFYIESENDKETALRVGYSEKIVKETGYEIFTWNLI